MNRALKNDFVVVTSNARDFIRLLNVEVHPGLIVLRESGLTRDEQWDHIRPVIEHVLESSDDNFWHVADLAGSDIGVVSYAYVLEKARAANDTRTVRGLERIGPPPFDSMEKIGLFFQALGKYECESDENPGAGVFSAPQYSLRDIYYLMKGFSQVPTFRVYQEMLSADLYSLRPDFKIPVFIFQGAEDERTPAPLAKEYFEWISAPQKGFVLFDGAGHFAALSMPDRFLQELVTHVRPVAVQP